MRNGIVACDEFWTICDARMSRTKRNILVANILSRSRKRSLTYLMTCQVADSVESRVRRVMDFTATPILNVDESICKVMIFRSGYAKTQNFMKLLYFKTKLFKSLYDTNEEIEMEENDKPLNPSIFQPSTINEDGKTVLGKPIIFKTWEKADKYAEQYWLNNILNKDKISELI